MSDPRLADDVLLDLAAVRGSLQQVWRAVEELHGCARSAERALDDVEAESSRARLATEDPQVAYLAVAGEQMDVLRQRCAFGANLASDIEARLDTAKHQLQAAHRRLADYEVVADGPTAAEVSALKSGSRASGAWSSWLPRWPRPPALTCKERPRAPPRWPTRP